MKLYKMRGGQVGILLSTLIFCVTCSCDPDPKPDTGNSDQFETTPERVTIAPGIIDEASGLAPSYNMSGSLWTNQDSGRPHSLYLISKDGKSIKEFNVPGTTNRDWEDVAIGPGPANGVNYLYIGDIGNNNSPISSTGTIYRVPEITDINGAFNQSDVEKMTFSYPDGPRDAEALLLDPASKDIFIISKEGASTGIYRLAFPQSITETMVAEKVGSVPSVSTVTGASVSKDGSEIILRTYLAAYYWKRTLGESVGQTLMKAATKQLLVALEPQGEGICFAADGNGFYTLSERSNAASVSLNYYKRK
ncbi:MAG: PE-PGRS family protein [Dyadobacter sp.]|uniref:PE-PGRS family protein n=1 Tax=Dyadobacter sp. TaxID=1914288 RepID=UPI003265A243